MRFYIEYCVFMCLSNDSLSESFPLPFPRPIPKSCCYLLGFLVKSLLLLSSLLRPSASFIHYEVVRWTSVSLLRNQAPTLAPDRWHQLATDHIPALPPTLQEIFSSSSLARNVSPNNPARWKVTYLFSISETSDQLPNAYF